MKQRRIMLMSGYLGSGKTTSMTALAEYLNKTGKKTCLITNDLGSNLVDTAYVNNHQIPVLEISNGCLCHDVPQLLEKINQHIEETDADIVIFEPVGSCVDMVKHVYKDIRENHCRDYILAPVSAVVDPIRFRSVYMEGQTGNDIGEQAVAYGFQKQLEEADLLLLNKIDMLTERDTAEIRNHMETVFPGVPVIEISGLKAQNIDKWAEYITCHESSLRDLDIDMGLIMEGCEDMGWYNKVSGICSDEEVDIQRICEAYLLEIRRIFRQEGKEILHLKVHIEQNGAFLKTALTSAAGELNTAGSLRSFRGKGRINVNIRALMQPEPLARLMEKQLEDVLQSHRVQITDNRLQSFLPVDEPPVPRERY